MGALIRQLGPRAKNGCAAGDPKAEYRFHIANRLWGQAGYPFQPPFLSTIRDHYLGGLGQVDFAHQPEPARQEINSWVAGQTEGKIPELIAEGLIRPDTRLVLTNAIYFKAPWARPFDPKLTKKGPFHLPDGRRIPVPMMFQNSELKYASLDKEGFDLLELDYASGHASMILLLPKEVGGLRELEAAVSVEKLARWRGALEKQQVAVFLPRFRATADLELAKVLKAMGMGLAFSDQADFSGMTGRKDLSLSEVVHQAFIEVDEEGTVAAAATAGMMLRSLPAVFRADHPFLFAIRDNGTGTITFLGRITNPAS